MDLPGWKEGDAGFNGILRAQVITNRERTRNPVKQHRGDAGGYRNPTVSAGTDRDGRIEVRGGGPRCHPLRLEVRR